MANKHLSLEPHDIAENTWWYEMSGGIDIIHYEQHGRECRPICIKISWRALRDALKRKDRKNKK